MTRYLVRLIDAAGRRMDQHVSARTGTTAAGLATRRAERETGRRWYAIDTTPLGVSS